MIEYFEKDGVQYGRDEHGEFRLDAGSAEPVEDRCGATLKFTFKRYGERRYCTALPLSTFVEDGPDYCKHHKSRKHLMEQNKENFETGAYVTSYVRMFDYMELHQKVIAISLYKDLMGQSIYDFEEEIQEVTFDASDVDWTENDVIVVDFPIATDYIAQSKFLFAAAIEVIKMENINTKIFKDSFKNRFAIGEREKVVTRTEFGEVRDLDEHHLNIPLSRIINNEDKLLKQGGVGIDESEAEDDMERVWVFETPKPE